VLDFDDAAPQFKAMRLSVGDDASAPPLAFDAARSKRSSCSASAFTAQPMNACFNSMRLLACAAEGGVNVAIASARIAIPVLIIFTMTMLQSAVAPASELARERQFTIVPRFLE
jgi:hypothetical protein